MTRLVFQRILLGKFIIGFLATFVLVMGGTLAFPAPIYGQLSGSLPQFSPVPVSNTTPANSNSANNSLDGIPVKLDDQILLLVHEGVGIYSARERADAIMRRIDTVAADRSIPVEVTLKDQADSTNVSMGGRTLITVRDIDAKEVGITRQVLAQGYRDNIQKGIEQYRYDRQPTTILRGVGICLVATLFLGLVIWLFQQLSSQRIRQNVRFTGHIPPLRLFGVELFPASNVTQVLANLLGFLRFILLLAACAIYLSLTFSQFVWTRELGSFLRGYLANSLQAALTTFAGYFPNLLNLLAIVVSVHYILKFISYFFNRIKVGAIVIPGFYPEWIAPTERLFSILLMGLAFMIAVPFLPGYGSPAFQGISIFFGVLLSLGATGTITNVIAGLVLIYARSFHRGDRIKVADIMGDVVEKTLLVTRIRSIKNEVITLPNSLILNNYIINYSRLIRAGEGALILYTSVTLGYDAPWRTVHAALIEAALATEHILQEPPPFVLQTSLNDYHITYQLNAYTDHPEMMADIYSHLHQNMQDKCNEKGIEILSPGYTSVRNGNHSTIPVSYLPDNYVPPTFDISTHFRK